MNNNKTTRALLGTGALALAGLVTMPAQAADAESIIRDRCLSCHTETGESATPFSRISEQRKTPEGWMMTISRMQQQRGLVISPEEKRTLVKYLADTQGLAPSETDGVRYLLEKEPNVVESFDQLVQETCVRCHSGARVALQRRTEDEWKHLIHFHMGQQPTAEFHAGARDRAWFDIALTNVAPKLAKDYPFNSDAWNNWQKVNKKSLNGSWAMTGYMPGKGTFDATLRVSKTAADNYTVALEGQYADGTPLNGEGRAIVYAGYEWRASLTIDGVKVRQVLAASADGSALEGRMFERDDEIMGGSVKAVKGNVITAVTPSYIKQGERKLVTISGNNLKGNVQLGNGVKMLNVVSRNANRVVVLAEASKTAHVGAITVKVGRTSAKGALAVYDQVARVEITPSESIARIGGAGGPIPKLKSAYRAVGYAAGADGKPGTDDDLRLGYMPAAWSLKPFDEVAQHDNDMKYAGTISRDGVFTPGDAGLNPERRMSTNNVGNLSVVGTVNDGNNNVQGEAHLLVTVQTFVKPVLQ